MPSSASKKGNGTVNSTDTAKYTITVSNSRSGTSYYVHVSDPLPDPAPLPTRRSSDLISGGTLSDAIGSLVAGGTVTIHLSAATAAGYSGTLTNTATATSTNNIGRAHV